MERHPRLAVIACAGLFCLGGVFTGPAYVGVGLVEATTVCVGDCDGNGQVTVDEILTMVNIALGNAMVSVCPAGDADHNNQITVDEILAAVNNALNGCGLVETPTPTATVTPTSSLSATVTPTSLPGTMTIAEAVRRNSQGQAIHLNETVTTEGIVTVAAGVFANNKLKIFAQSGGAGILVYAPSVANVPAFQAGDQLRVTGVIGQLDTTDYVENGTVFIDISAGSSAVVSGGNPLPGPQPVHLSDLLANGTAYVGALVSVANVQKVAGSWPVVGSKSASVTVSDDGGTTQLPLKFQKNTISADLVSKLNSIGTGPFTLAGIVVQNAPSTSNLLNGFEIWVRGAGDINP